MQHDLLTEPLLTARDADGGERGYSLPGLLSALGRDDIESLPRVQRHQADAIHIFLCYLAGIALSRGERGDPAQQEAFWREQLRELGDSKNDAAWCLFVEDPLSPAFMQPPVRTQDQFKGFKPKAGTPDELDVLQAAKNHDVKRTRMQVAAVEDWIYALVSLQTMSGFLGAGNYGIARMNSGFGSRACVGVITSGRMSDRWHRDTQILLSRRPQLLPPDWPYDRRGSALLWSIPWDGTTSLALDELDPFFIEVARLVRLTGVDGNFQAFGKASNAQRVAAKQQKGNLGDPWTPIARRTNGALTVSAGGFTPQLLRDLLLDSDKYQPALMQQIEPGQSGCWVHASVLVRGNGTTDGFHEAWIPVEQRARSALAGGAEREWLARISAWALDQTSDVQNRALRRALFALVEGGPAGGPDTAKREAGQWVEGFLDHYARLWGEAFFPWLWHTLDVDEDSAKRDWMERVHSMAESTLDDAIERSPERSGRRYRGRVRAKGVLQGVWHKHFGIKENQNGE